MSKQTINIGSVANDGTGDPLRTAFDKVNDNFTECYDAIRSVGTDVFIVNPADNSTDGSVSIVFIAGGRSSDPNIVGSTGKPTKTDHTPPGWSDDSGYVDGTADVATIGGGYDHVCNQLAGTICGGGHNFIKSHASGHSFIGGGSYNVVAGGRSGIVCGRANAIDSAAVLSFIGGGEANFVSGSSSGVLSGDDNVVSGGYSGVLSGDTNVVSGGYSGVLSGLSVTVSGNYSGAAGRSTTVSGNNSFAAGSFSTVSHDNSAAFGSRAISRASGTLTIANSRLAEDGDAQSIRWSANIRTTNASATNTTSQMSLPSGKVCAGTGKVMLIAMLDGSADGNNDGVYTQASYQLEFGFFWNGTTGLFYDAAGTTSLVAGPTRDLTAIRDNLSLGTVPQLRLNTGSLRVNVTGQTGKIINWAVTFDLTMTLVS